MSSDRDSMAVHTKLRSPVSFRTEARPSIRRRRKYCPRKNALIAIRTWRQLTAVLKVCEPIPQPARGAFSPKRPRRLARVQMRQLAEQRAYKTLLSLSRKPGNGEWSVVAPLQGNRRPVSAHFLSWKSIRREFRYGLVALNHLSWHSFHCHRILVQDRD
jgi:hypothetical protein